MYFTFAFAACSAAYILHDSSTGTAAASPWKIHTGVLPMRRAVSAYGSETLGSLTRLTLN
ncbi:MAG TPA: hypothetical protein VGZ73_31460 [Bryobacteraceae bacterium]|nr:hypothetical protein [Bryobacteraceae bacterium]